MTRNQQIAVAVVAMLLIYYLIPSGPRQVLTNASGLSSQFQQVGGQAAFAAVAQALPQTLPANGLPVEGAPTISVAQIERVLAEYDSPAQGYGQEIYDLGLQYGINPAIMLAFFIHESSAGSNPAWAGIKEDGTLTYNVGNIICTEGWRCYGRFRDYNSWSEGIADWYKLIKNLYIAEWGLRTVEDIIPRYAPAADNNDEGAYIQSVRNLVQSWNGK